MVFLTKFYFHLFLGILLELAVPCTSSPITNDPPQNIFNNTDDPQNGQIRRNIDHPGNLTSTSTRQNDNNNENNNNNNNLGFWRPRPINGQNIFKNADSPQNLQIRRNIDHPGNLTSTRQNDNSNNNNNNPGIWGPRQINGYLSQVGQVIGGVGSIVNGVFSGFTGLFQNNINRTSQFFNGVANGINANGINTNAINTNAINTSPVSGNPSPVYGVPNLVTVRPLYGVPGYHSPGHTNYNNYGMITWPNNNNNIGYGWTGTDSNKYNGWRNVGLTLGRLIQASGRGTTAALRGTSQALQTFSQVVQGFQSAVSTTNNNDNNINHNHNHIVNNHIDTSHHILPSVVGTGWTTSSINSGGISGLQNNILAYVPPVHTSSTSGISIDHHHNTHNIHPGGLNSLLPGHGGYYEVPEWRRGSVALQL